MEIWGFSSILALGVAVAAVIFVAGVIACLFTWLYLSYRNAALKTRGTQAQQVEALNERIGRLENKCAAMQEQITDAHMLLTDERRELDKKLSKAFPEVMPPVPEEPERKSRSARRERTRE